MDHSHRLAVLTGFVEKLTESAKWYMCALCTQMTRQKELEVIKLASLANFFRLLEPLPRSNLEMASALMQGMMLEQTGLKVTNEVPRGS